MVDDYWAASSAGTGADAGYYDMLGIDLRSAAEQEVYGLSGGFLFLGVFLGVVFMMATVLIIYYKQVSEGYEDNARFDIMRKVGLSEREARRAIRSQILTVFFMPILVAAVHIAFDFNLVVQLLRLFSLTNLRLTALCTLGTLLVFWRGVRGGVRPDRAVVLQDSPSEQREREIGGAGIWTLQMLLIINFHRGADNPDRPAAA